MAYQPHLSISGSDSFRLPTAGTKEFTQPEPAQSDLPLTLDGALRMALENSDIVRTLDQDEVSIASATHYDASIQSEAIRAALADFDTRLESNLLWNRFEGPPNSFFGPGIEREDRRDEGTIATGFSKRWYPGTQTRIAYNPSPGYLFFPRGTSGLNPIHQSALELEVRQRLLQGGGVAVNTAPISVAQLKTDQSAWEFQGALLKLVRSVEQSYWELYAARVAKQVIEEQVPLIDEVVRVEEANRAAERAVGADVAKARTQLYRIRQRLVQSGRIIRQKELALGSLICSGPNQQVSFIPTTSPIDAPIVINKQESIAMAVTQNPLLIQRRIQTRLLELELVVAKNKYLPNFDVQALYRANGLQDDLGSSLRMMLDNDFYDWQFGATFSVPLGRNASKAALRAAELQIARENARLREQVDLMVFDILESCARIESLHNEYVAAKSRVEQAREWLKGARVRHANPPPSGRNENWMLVALDDLLFALQASASASEEAASLLADYNIELAKLFELEGSLRRGFNVQLQQDPSTSKIIEQLPKIDIPAVKDDAEEASDSVEKQHIRKPEKSTSLDRKSPGQAYLLQVFGPEVERAKSKPGFQKSQPNPTDDLLTPHGRIVGVRPFLTFLDNIESAEPSLPYVEVSKPAENTPSAVMQLDLERIEEQTLPSKSWQPRKDEPSPN